MKNSQVKSENLNKQKIGNRVCWDTLLGEKLWQILANFGSGKRVESRFFGVGKKIKYTSLRQGNTRLQERKQMKNSQVKSENLNKQKIANRVCWDTLLGEKLWQILANFGSGKRVGSRFFGVGKKIKYTSLRRKEPRSRGPGSRGRKKTAMIFMIVTWQVIGHKYLHTHTFLQALQGDNF